MEFREYLERIGIRELTNNQRIDEWKKIVLGLGYEDRKNLKKHIKLFEENSTKNWMDHLNSPFAKTYDAAFSSAKSLREYEEVADEMKGGTEKRYMVDVGAGTGIMTNYMAMTNPDKRVVALDVSEGALRESMRKASVLGLYNIDYVVCDARYMPIRGSIDPKICRTRLSGKNLPKDEYSRIESEIERIS